MRTLLALALFLIASASFAAEPVFPPGSRIGLIPPAGMTLAEGFQGFEDRATGAKLVVSEFSPRSFDKAEKDFSPETMQAGGMEPLSRETIALAGGSALLIMARQSESGVPMRKWALLTRGGDIGVMVIGALPESALGTYPDAAVRAALASIVVRAKLSPDELLALLPYRLEDLGGFRLLRASPDGTAVLTFGPNDTTLPLEQPFFMLAPRAVEPPSVSERGRFAQLALAAFLKNPDLRVVSSEAIRIGGGPGHEIVAETKDKVTGDDLMMVQWMRFDPGVVQMLGFARKDQWAGALPRMRALRDGFARK
jgi:hypothetical protein